jgi:DNA-binding transcriptional ArsR family regulator
MNNLKSKLYATQTSLLEALANPKKLQILDLLTQAERSAEEIAEQLNFL